MNHGIHVFAGPTKSGLRPSLHVDDRVIWHPPVRRNDIQRLATSTAPATLAIVDGVFHGYPAVGHREIREAIAAGWRVWGLSSMGAIRAFEMRALGMRGFGCVYERFLGADDFRDDEVALLHLPEPPYTAITEPLVHIRACFESAQNGGLADAAAAASALAVLSDQWYGYRTLALAESALGAAWRGTPRELHEWMADFARFRLKTIDLEHFLTTAPWVI
jgi:hypothetical protein